MLLAAPKHEHVESEASGVFASLGLEHDNKPLFNVKQLGPTDLAILRPDTSV